MNATNVIPAETNLLNKPMLEERVNPGWWAVAAAIAAGIAGTVALTKSKTDTLVGTVAALALVPAGAAAGIAFLSKDPARGVGGLLLLGVNVGLIIAMGILALAVMDVWASARDKRPQQRRSYAMIAVAVAIALVVAVVLALALQGGAAPAEPPSF